MNVTMWPNSFNSRPTPSDTRQLCMMHHCLQISEILTCIFEFCLSLDDTIPSFSGHKDRRRELAATARTCKAFYEPSLDILYYAISSVSVLFKCLPKAVWYEKDLPGRGSRILVSCAFTCYHQHSCNTHLAFQNIPYT